MADHSTLVRISLTTLGLLVAATAGLFVLGSCSTTPPTDLGRHGDQLAPCPDSPNCVTSFAADADHRVEPISFAGDADAARVRLRQVLTAMPRARIVTEDDRYLRVEFTSALFRFVDDVEFLIDAAAGCVHVRSASRVGHSDLGANRKRVEQIRAAFAGT